MKLPTELSDDSFGVDRRQFVKGALGTAAAVAAIPAISTTAAAHFPEELAIDIEPDNSENRVDPDETDHVTVAVRYTEFEDEEGAHTVFDPTAEGVRYRFGSHRVLENGGGVRPVGDGEVEDVDGDGNDGLVLRFPLDGAGLTNHDGRATVFWERDETGEHGLAGSDSLTLAGETYTSDIDVLNYALALEHLEHAFYRDALASSGGVFTEHDVERSEIARYFDRPTLRFSTYQQFEALRDQEKAHVDALTTTIEDLGGIPVTEGEYDFGDAYETVEQFVAVAARLEDVGVSAYAGAAPLISNADLIPPALSIHSVEARHAAYLDTLNLRRAFPDAFDKARSMDQVLPIAEQFVADE